MQKAQMDTKLYATFNIISPPKGFEKVMPFKVTFDLAEPEDNIPVDERTFGLQSLGREIQATIRELVTHCEETAPNTHPDIVLMRTAYQILETWDTSPTQILSDLGITRDIG